MIPYYVDAFKNKKITENGGIFKNSTDLGCNQLVICDVIINYIYTCQKLEFRLSTKNGFFYLLASHKT